MNIDEYRAMVAQEAEVPVVTTEGGIPDVQVNQSTTVAPEQTVQTPGETQPIPNDSAIETETALAPQTVILNGVEVPLTEVEQGYLRQADYTKKTQDIARINKESEVAKQYFEAINTDPEFAEGIARRFGLPYMTPEEMSRQQLTNDYHSLLLERDVDNLKLKFKDVDVQEVVKTAYENKIDSLEDAYHLLQGRKAATAPPADIESLREQIRQEVALELQSNVDTSTTIGTGGTAQQVQSNSPELSAGEMRVAQNMNMTAVEYAKWKNA